MPTQRVCFEELLVAIELVGRLQGDDMRANVNPQKFVPPGMNSIEEMSVACPSNLDQTGMSAGYMILAGGGIVNSPQEILMGCAGATDIDAGHSPVSATVLRDMGIKTTPGGEYTVNFQWVGVLIDEGVFVSELVFNSKSVRKAKHWVARAIETAVVNTNVQAANLAGVAALVAPGKSTLIDGIIKCGGFDLAALGCHAEIMLLSEGCSPPQEILCAAGGGENQTAAGGNVMPTQEINCDIAINEKEGIYVEARGVGEAGVGIAAVSLGLAV